MRPSAALKIHQDAIRRIVFENNATNPRVFGSVLHGDDHEDSDLDILIEPTDQTTLFDIGAIRHKIRDLTGVEVDVLTPQSLSPGIRAEILQEARSL